MSKENALLFLEKVNKDRELNDLVNQEGADFVKIAKDAGLDLTQEELDEAVEELRERRKNAVLETLSPEELEKVAGGTDCPQMFFDIHEDAPDGHEIGCFIPWHGKDWCNENNTYCNRNYICYTHYHECISYGGSTS